MYIFIFIFIYLFIFIFIFIYIRTVSLYMCLDAYLQRPIRDSSDYKLFGAPGGLPPDVPWDLAFTCTRRLKLPTSS